jgi:hypothetical protein
MIWLEVFIWVLVLIYSVALWWICREWKKEIEKGEWPQWKDLCEADEVWLY